MRPALALATLALVTAAAPALRAEAPDGGALPSAAADAGMALDAGVAADAGVALDAGVAADAGVALDAGVAADARTPAGPPAALSNVPAPESGKIARIVVQGNRRVETDAIRAVLPLKVGEDYDKKKL